jgi:3-hydroxyacyl-CoA dehydrogenase
MNDILETALRQTSSRPSGRRQGEHGHDAHPQRFLVRKAAVLGAGVMGAQIAAHLANANVQPILFELAAEGKDKNANVKKAIDGLAKLSPSPLAAAGALKQIVAANYDEHLELLRGCDLVIEAISERMDWKKALFAKVAPHLAPGAIFASNTSGLSITELSKTLPAEQRRRFCGIHFFNPPRYMKLVEIIPTAETDPQVLDELETFLTTTLGKGVIRAKDTPNFVANRVGVFSMLATMHHTTGFNLGFDEVTRSPDRRSAAARARPTAPPTSSASTRWCTSSRRCRTRCPPTRGFRITSRPRGSRGWWARARSARRRRPAST